MELAVHWFVLILQMKTMASPFFACSECNEPLCDECQEVKFFPFCEVCEKFFCERCADMNYCSNDNCNLNGCFPCRACAPDAMTSWSSSSSAKWSSESTKWSSSSSGDWNGEIIWVENDWHSSGKSVSYCCAFSCILILCCSYLVHCW